jgi:cytochrome c biogenesis protein ResB
MSARRNYRIAATLLLLAIAAAGYCFYELGKVGLSDPDKAQFWYAWLLAALGVSLIACLAFYYYRAKSAHTSNDEIAIQALAAAGRNVAKVKAQQAAAEAKQPAKQSGK